MTIGLAHLPMPFVGKISDYAINRRQWESKP
jgi:hypothetical protein